MNCATHWFGARDQFRSLLQVTRENLQLFAIARNRHRAEYLNGITSLQQGADRQDGKAIRAAVDGDYRCVKLVNRHRGWCCTT